MYAKRYRGYTAPIAYVWQLREIRDRWPPKVGHLSRAQSLGATPLGDLFRDALATGNVHETFCQPVASAGSGSV